MKRIFRSRIAPPLTESQIDNLSTLSHLPREDIDDWHARFLSCYPYGSLSQKQFISYYKQLRTYNGQEAQPSKPIVKQLFSVFDLDDDKKLRFDEFFLFNVLIRRGSVIDKLKVTLKLYDKNKNKLLSREELEHVLTNMFDLLRIPKTTNNLSQTIDTILTRANLNNNRNAKISWSEFSSHILNNQTSFELLIPSTDEFNNEIIYPTTRL